MSLYISKNNQQAGPFEEWKVLEMLKNGGLSPNDPAIREGEKEWQKLSFYFPNVGNIAPAGVVAGRPAARKSKTGLLLGCGGFLLVGLLMTAVVGVFAYRNLFPADSTENLPNAVKDFKLDDRYPPKGNIWGTQTDFSGIYSNPSKSETVIYQMTVYSNETAASDAMRRDLYKYCKSGDTPLRFSFVKNGADLSEGAACGGLLYIRKDKRVVALIGSDATVQTLTEFAENLPFNAGSTMIEKTSK